MKGSYSQDSKSCLWLANKRQTSLWKSWGAPSRSCCPTWVWVRVCVPPPLPVRAPCLPGGKCHTPNQAPIPDPLPAFSGTLPSLRKPGPCFLAGPSVAQSVGGGLTGTSGHPSGAVVWEVLPAPLPGSPVLTASCARPHKGAEPAHSSTCESSRQPERVWA